MSVPFERFPEFDPIDDGLVFGVDGDGQVYNLDTEGTDSLQNPWCADYMADPHRDNGENDRYGQPN